MANNAYAERPLRNAQILAEALELYRRERVAAGCGCAGQMVADSWGALRLERDLVLSLMEDEDGLFDA